MDGTIQWGILGTANIARAALIPAMRNAANSVPIAVGSRESSRAKEFARENDLPVWYGSYEELLANPELDAIYIALPNSLHKEWSIKAAQAGKHILCEKPLALNAQECTEMEGAAKANGVRLMEAFMYRFHPRTEQVKRMIDSGRIGRLSAIDAAFTFRLTKKENIRFSSQLGGGALMDVGCYCVNVIRTMTAQEPNLVTAFKVTGESGVDLRLTGNMLLPKGVIAHFDCSLVDERREHYTIAGENGYLYVDQAFLPGIEASRIYEVCGRDHKVVHEVKGEDEYQLMVEHFSTAVIEGTSFRYGASEAAANMRVLNALVESARKDGIAVAPKSAEGEG